MTRLFSADKKWQIETVCPSGYLHRALLQFNHNDSDISREENLRVQGPHDLSNVVHLKI